MEEKWKVWTPIKNLKSRYWIDSLTDNKHGFKILLEPEDQDSHKLEINFKDSVYVYRKIDESYIGKILFKVQEKHGPIIKNNCFFKIEKSDFLTFLSSSSGGWSDAIPMIHFVILEENSLLDIVADYEPEVRFL